MSDNPKEPPKEKASEEVIKEDIQVSFPLHVIQEILVALPVKSLFLFKCVSPSWRFLLHSNAFIKAHIARPIPKLFIKTPERLFVVEFKTQTKPTLEALPLKEERATILGSCNGVISSLCNGVTLQNPYTQTLYKLPGSKKTAAYRRFKSGYFQKLESILGFWYDEPTDDYKVLINCQYRHPLPADRIPAGDYDMVISEVSVYSFRNKAYNRNNPFPYLIKPTPRENVFVGGALHWVVGTLGSDNHMLIGSFNVVSGEARLDKASCTRKVVESLVKLCKWKKNRKKRQKKTRKERKNEKEKEKENDKGISDCFRYLD